MEPSATASGRVGSGAAPILLRAAAGIDDLTRAPRPHVLLAVDQLSRNLGGGERVLLRLAALLPRYGFRPSILTLHADPESPALAGTAPFPIYMLPLTRTYGPEAAVAAWQLQRFLRAQNVRLVQTFFESSDLWVGPIAKLTGTRLIWSRRDMGILRDSRHRAAYRLMAGLPDAVLAVSEQVRRHAIEVDGIPADRVETLYNGLDLAEWLSETPLPSVSSEPVIKTVGNVRRVKGHDVFLKAAALVATRYPHARFSIAGAILDSTFYEELQKIVHDSGLAERVTFEGSVTDLKSYLRDATLFVLPSRSEGFSNAIIEAMAAGLPVVATDVGGNAEAVCDGQTGHIVPAEDVHALAAAMGEMIEHPERANEMGQAGRTRVQERFTTEATMRQLVSTYHRVLGRNPDR